MNEPTIRKLSVQDVFEFNQYLVCLEKAGLPIKLDFSSKPLSLEDKLSGINSKLVAAGKEGGNLGSILLDEKQLPTPYCVSLMAWHAGNKNPAAIAPLHDLGANRQDVSDRIKAAFLPLIVLLWVSYAVLIVLVLVLVPNLKTIYSETASEPGAGWLAMSTIRDWMPIWIPLLPVILIVGWIGLRRSWQHFNLAFLSSRSKEMLAKEAACIAESLSLAAKSITTIDEHPAWFDRNTDSPRNLSLIGWAIAKGNIYFSRSDTLRFASTVHRNSASRSARRWHAFFPAVIVGVLGGALVLAVGIGLFAPLIELLIAISRP